jgi:hypothetical protein
MFEEPESELDNPEPFVAPLLATEKRNTSTVGPGSSRTPFSSTPSRYKRRLALGTEREAGFGVNGS